MEQNIAKAATTAAPVTPKGLSVVKSPIETQAPVTPVAAEKQKTLTIEQRLKKIEQLYKLKDRREELVQHLSNLNDFNIDPTGSANLKLDDGNNHRFTIANAETIVEMVELLKAKVIGYIAEIDSKIQF